MPTTRRKQLLDFVETHRDCTFPEIHRALQTTRGNASLIVGLALAEGLVSHWGDRRRYRYRLTAKGLYAANPTRVGVSSVFNLGASL